MKFFVTLISVVVSLFSSNTWAQPGPSLFIATYPQKLTVSYGANHQPVQLQYTIVSNLPGKSQTLSKFEFASRTPNSRIIVSSITNTCQSVLQPQGPKGVCTVNVNVQVSGIQYPSHSALPIAPYHLQFTYGSGRGTTMVSKPINFQFATGASIPTAARTFTFKNYCNYAVWLGISGGATNSIKPVIAKDLQSCKDTVRSSDCYPGSTCVPVGSGVNHCFWKNPVPTGGNYQLAKNGSATVSFPVYDNGIDAQWSGGVAGRTNCTSTGCDTGDCNGGAASGHNGACKVATGFNAPVSTAEFTLLGALPLVYSNTAQGNTDVDTYDVTVINGVTTPISMKPANGVWGGRAKPYRCGVPGASTNTQSSAACEWSSFNPPNSKAYLWVKFQSSAIENECLNTNCTQGKSCGASFNPGSGGKVVKNVCGQALGFWTADAFCAKDATFQDSRIGVNCSARLASPDSQYTQAQLYGCSTGIFKNSCYTTGAVSGSCCGCVDWNTLGINVPAPPITQSCNGIKTENWVTVSQPKLEWLKDACSNAYVYPYDDASSTFTCQKLNSQDINQVNYVISFCPQT
ncbi:thaumatin family protein [Legionella brunensis]|uniref:Thaumatin domain-containing protein n=1 Tax=Legionella brunensis TaxID=29422 RepID=A0A0W0S4G6_9GAMM|nr:thaumatin family protein [Legionella brunensis]KTC77988.1 thaumatin domain-containing protein [Legionella brunensis]